MKGEIPHAIFLYAISVIHGIGGNQYFHRKGNCVPRTRISIFRISLFDRHPDPFAVACQAGRMTSWSKEEGKVLFWQSFFGVFLFSICMLYGVQWTTATSAGIITSTVPACIALFSFWLLKEKLLVNNVVAILLSVCGIGLITFTGGQAEQSLVSMLGNLLVFLAVISEALFTIFAKRLSGKITPFQMTAAINVISFMLFLPFAVTELLTFEWGSVPATIWLLIVYYAVTASVLSFYLWYRGVAKVEASRAGLFTGMMPISAALVAVLFLGEAFTWMHAIGMSLVLGAIVVGTMRTGKKGASLEV